MLKYFAHESQAHVFGKPFAISLASREHILYKGIARHERVK
jgi:hypothetical protein